MNLTRPALTLALVALLPCSAMAASSSATFDWSQVSFKTFGDIVYDWDSISYVSASANSVFDLQSGELPLNAHAAAGGAAASASQSLAHWSAQASASHADDNAYGRSSREGSLRITGEGVLVVTLPYTLSVDTAGGGYSTAGAYLGIYDFDGGLQTWSYSQAWLDSYAGATTKSGRLSFSIYSDGAFHGQFSAQAWSTAYVAAVPEPTSYAMMLGGLALIGGLARRQKRS